MVMLEARNLRKTYRLSRGNTLQALGGVDIDIEVGEMVAIMGPSGSGKSTLMHILGLLHSPDDDVEPVPMLRIDGKDMTRLSDGERTRMRATTMGFVFQSFNLVPTLTALENVALAAEYAGVSGGTARAMAREALGSVGLAGRADHRPMELSGGEQQRVAIARAVVNRPQILLCDEPTGNLDQAISLDIVRLLDRINRTGTTIVMATHDHDIVNDLRRRVIQLRDGKVVRDEQDATYHPASED
jgi:cell division transport system ATP-binding protein